jgi:hypothetical protein
MKKEKDVSIWCAGDSFNSFLHETERAPVFQPPFNCGALQLRTHLSTAITMKT